MIKNSEEAFKKLGYHPFYDIDIIVGYTAKCANPKYKKYIIFYSDRRIEAYAGSKIKDDNFPCYLSRKEIITILNQMNELGWDISNKYYD